MDSITLTLCSKLKSVTNRESLMYLIDDVLEGNIQNKQGAVEKLTSYLTGLGVSDFDTSDISLHNIKQALLAVEVAKVVLPYIPKTELLERLHAAVNPSDSPILLEVSVDEGLKGGFVVYKAGKVVDMSFKTKVEKLFKQDSFRAKVLQILQ